MKAEIEYGDGNKVVISEPFEFRVINDEGKTLLEVIYNINGDCWIDMRKVIYERREFDKDGF